MNAAAQASRTAQEHTPERASMPSGVLPSLTGLRAIAALLVFGRHAYALLATTSLWNIARHLFPQGNTGVSFFFILSGFVLTWSMRPDDRPLAFYRRRFARVYPNHLLMWIAAVPVVLCLGGTFASGVFLAGLFLIQAFIPNHSYVFGFNAPDWSLSCEAFFYALFPFAVLIAVRLGKIRRAVLIAIVLAAMAMPAVSSVIAADHRIWFTYEFPPVRFLEFAAGVLLALEIRGGRWPRIPLWAVTVLAVIAYGIASAPSHFYPGPNAALAVPVAVTIIPFVLLIGAVAQADIAGRRTVLSRRWVVRLGEWSFAFYLVHLLWIEAFHKAAESHFVGTGPRVVEVLIVLTLSVGTAALIYHFYERPLERRLRHSVRRSALALETDGVPPVLPA
jgi:peptidoglycan/LPS O-acetylase OafA/YrhL